MANNGGLKHITSTYYKSTQNTCIFFNPIIKIWIWENNFERWGSFLLLNVSLIFSLYVFFWLNGLFLKFWNLLPLFEKHFFGCIQKNILSLWIIQVFITKISYETFSSSEKLIKETYSLSKTLYILSDIIL